MIQESGAFQQLGIHRQSLLCSLNTPGGISIQRNSKQLLLICEVYMQKNFNAIN